MLSLAAFCAWHDLSHNLLSALNKLLRSSPILVEMRIESFDLTPISFISQFSQLRRLVLFDIMFNLDSPGQSSQVRTSTMPKLEALELSHVGTSLPPALFLLTERLRLLSIWSSDPETLNLDTLSAVKDVIRSSATSIHSIIWEYYCCLGMYVISHAVSILMLRLTAIARAVQLGMICNLQYLLFIITMSERREDHFNVNLISVIQHLEDHAVTTNLKELTIAIKPRKYPNYKDAVGSLVNCQGWERLDSILPNRSPALQKVLIAVDVQGMDYPDTDDRLQIMMQLRLPQLAERGVLLAERQTIREV
jgi:hypothetical protein